ncbi:hypothetical protein Tco_0947225, partial [Tanacetum coccineum]
MLEGRQQEKGRDQLCQILNLYEKVSYPSWHSKYKVSKQFEPRDGQNRGQGQVTVAHVESGNVSFTPQQFGQLLRSFQIKNAAADDDFAV